MDRPRFSTFTVPVLLLLMTLPVQAQELIRDASQRMTLPEIKAIGSSETHLYLLSEQEGLAVFRSYADSLQWLYTSEGMQQRGNQLESDIRFSYLYGEGSQLTVIEPTSLLGVYSSTTLPHPPTSVQRLHDRLYLILNGELHALSLESPDRVDRAPESTLAGELSGRTLLDMVSDQRGSLYLLEEGGQIHHARQESADTALTLDRTIQTGQSFESIFMTSEDLLGVTEDGEIHRIGARGNTELRYRTDHAVVNLQEWESFWVLSLENGMIQLVEPSRREATLLRDANTDPALFTVADNRLWLVEQNRVTPVLLGESTLDSRVDEPIRIHTINSFSTPVSQPVLIPLDLSGLDENESVDFSYQSETIGNARIRGRTFYWTPGPGDVGRHSVEITAMTAAGDRSQTRFELDVRPFNTPPRFAPLPRQRIPAGEEWVLEVEAFDPDGRDANLIRYIGVDLPDGLSLDNRSGTLHWSPSRQQIGEHNFQLIATDQYGAANRVHIQVTVAEASQESDQEFPFE